MSNMDDTPLMPKQSRLLTKSVVIGVSVFCLFVIAIVGVAVLSNHTVTTAQKQGMQKVYNI